MSFNRTRTAAVGDWRHALHGRTAARAFGTLLCVLAALVAVQSGRLGLSGLIVELGQQEVERWNAPPRPRSMGEINRVARYFTDSLDFQPDNPWALERLGALDLTRMRQSKIPSQALAYAWAARLRYRHALRYRPTSPFLWANLALAKLYLDEVDEELSGALRNADLLGPWEPETQRTALYVGLAVWDRLDPGLRRSMRALLERGAVRNAPKMVEIVKSFGRLDLICGLAVYHGEVRALCEKEGFSAHGGAPEAGKK